MVKTIFIEARYKGSLSLPKSLVRTLPKRLFLLASVQYAAFLKGISLQLKKSGISASLPRLRHAAYPGQLLGCSLESLPKSAGTALYIGDGSFHPLALVHNQGLRIIFFNPLSKKWGEISGADKKRAQKRQFYLEKSFLSSQKFGILVSTKPGQNRLEEAIALKKYLTGKGMFAMLLIANDIDLAALEDWNFIECFVNTACPRLEDDTKLPVIGLESAKKLIKLIGN